MSLESCIRSAKKWVDENSDVELNAKELEQVGRLMNAAEELGATPAEKNKLMADLVDQKIAADQARARAKAYLNAITVEKGKSQTIGNYQDWIEKGHDPNKAPVDAFLARIRGGAYRPGEGTNLDPLYLTRSARAQYLQFFRNELGPEDAKLLQTTKIGDPMSRDIYQELNAIEQKLQLGQSNNESALRIAKAIRATQDYVLSDVKGVNPYVEAAKDFLVHRNHNRDAIAAVPKEQWVKEAMGDFAGSFLGATPAEKEGIFRDTYDQIVSGTYGSTDFDPATFWKPGSTAGNQAARAAGSRTFVATDWMHEWQYASKYGDDIWSNMLRQIDRQSSNVARLQKWGPSPAENFQSEYSAVLKSLPSPEQKAAFQQSQSRFKEAFEVTMGRQDNEAHGLLARSAQNLMSIENASMLGFHVPRSLNGLQAGITLARDAFGKTYAENAFDIVGGIAQKMLPLGNGGREALEAMGGALQETARDAMGQLMPDSQRPGMSARIGSAVGKLSLTDRWVASQKYGLIHFLTKELGARAHAGFEGLPPQTQEMLGRYDLAGPKWEVLKQAVIPDGPLKGQITPDSIRRLSDTQVAPLKQTESPRELNRIRAELALNYGALLNDQAGLTVGESNSRSRIAAYGTSTINDPWGIARRFMMQFKQAALMRQQLAMRTFQSGGGATSGTSGVIQLALGSAFLSMMGEGLIALSAGKTLPSPTSPDTLSHTIRGTGLLGVYGDILVDALSRPTPDKQEMVMGSEILGPSFGTIARAGVAGYKSAKGAFEYTQGVEKSDQFAGKEWARLIHNVTPGQNLFYTKAALDFMLMNELHEFMGGGGYLESLRQQTQKTPAWPEALGGDGGQQQYTFGGKNFWE